MAKKITRKKGGNKKHGRNIEKCKRYRDSNRREINKARKAAKERKKAEKLAKKRIEKSL